MRLDYEVAGPGSRFIATLVDSLVFSIALMVLLIAAVFVIGFAGTAQDFANIMPIRSTPRGAPTIDYGSAAWIVAIVFAISFALTWGYFVLFEMLWSGQTPGKRIAGLRVVGQDGYPVTFAASLIRNVVRLIDILPMYYGIGLLVMLIDSRSRRLGDLAAGTLVVKERAPLFADELVTDFDETLQADETVPNVERLGEPERALVDNFLSRRRDLTPRSRVALARSLSIQVAARLEYDLGSTPPTRFLRLVQRTYRPEPAAPAANGTIENLERLTGTEYTMIREYFLRCDSLSSQRAGELAQQIARTIAARLAYDLGDEDPTAFLRRVGDAYRLCAATPER